MFFDTHSHIDWWKPEQYPEVLKGAADGGVDRIVVVGRNVESSAATAWAAQHYAPLYAGVGIHPWRPERVDDEAYWQLKDLARSNNKVVAIGEVGIGIGEGVQRFNIPADPADVQAEKFRRQIRLAREVGKPLIVHNDRGSGALILQCLKEEKAMDVGAVLHSTWMGVDEAKPLWELGMFISISRFVYQEGFEFVQDVARQVPISQLVIETDSAGPEHGSPAEVRSVAEKVAELRGMSVEEVAEITQANARRLFRI